MRYCPSIYLQVLRKTTKTFGQDGRISELNLGPSKYEAKKKLDRQLQCMVLPCCLVEFYRCSEGRLVVWYHITWHNITEK